MSTSKQKRAPCSLCNRLTYVHRGEVIQNEKIAAFVCDWCVHCSWAMPTAKLVPDMPQFPSKKQRLATKPTPRVLFQPKHPYVRPCKPTCTSLRPAPRTDSSHECVRCGKPWKWDGTEQASSAVPEQASKL